MTFVEPEVQLGVCPDTLEVYEWIRIRMREVTGKSPDDEMSSDYLFAFSLAGLNKLRANPLPISNVSALFGLPPERTRCMDDGAAHLVASLHTLGDKLPGGPIWNFAIGTGVGFGFTDDDHNVRDRYDLWRFFGGNPWRSIEPSTGRKVWVACGSKCGFDQIVHENGGVADDEAFMQFASRWKGYIETGIIDRGTRDGFGRSRGIPSAVVFTGGHVDRYGDHLVESLREVGLAVPSFAGPEHAGLLGAALNTVTNRSTITPLIKAIEEEEIRDVALLLEKGAEVNTRDAFGHFPVIYAINSGKTDCVELLTTFGAELNAPDFSGHTPIYFAIMNNDYEMVELLIEKGAKVNIPDYWGRRPLDFSKENSKIEFLLLSHGAIDVHGKR
ncbi:MAG: ankyrin repeat domain-containing protein [Simkaniaceae bacterium]|nr:ankyrin repeat domain-containing protein [Simkaniaceae bacterium]